MEKALDSFLKTDIIIIVLLILLRNTNVRVMHCYKIYNTTAPVCFADIVCYCDHYVLSYEHDSWRTVQYRTCQC